MFRFSVLRHDMTPFNSVGTAWNEIACSDIWRKNRDSYINTYKPSVDQTDDDHTEILLWSWLNGSIKELSFSNVIADDYNYNKANKYCLLTITSVDIITGELTKDNPIIAKLKDYPYCYLLITVNLCWYRRNDSTQLGTFIVRTDVRCQHSWRLQSILFGPDPSLRVASIRLSICSSIWRFDVLSVRLSDARLYVCPSVWLPVSARDRQIDRQIDRQTDRQTDCLCVCMSVCLPFAYLPVGQVVKNSEEYPSSAALPPTTVVVVFKNCVPFSTFFQAEWKQKVLWISKITQYSHKCIADCDRCARFLHKKNRARRESVATPLVFFVHVQHGFHGNKWKHRISVVV